MKNIIYFVMIQYIVKDKVVAKLMQLIRINIRVLAFLTLKGNLVNERNVNYKYYKIKLLL